ncbi:hypothetical protein [Catelliglobosispora koreensis]|uniref:hypothetical protein n=1 Tax=Catelliglobosispora koreensis TaxID=129052 RepID=UPI00036FBD6F|nr:hypothetical protein [Catelliglobosispora koreensis]
MAIIDKLFPAPEVDARLPLVAQLVAQLLVEHGLAQIYHVPGDQVSALRKEIRRRVRDLSGHPIKTNYVGGVIHAECEPVYEIHAMTYQRAAVEALPSFLTGSDESALPSLPDWNVYWGNWAVS